MQSRVWQKKHNEAMKTFRVLFLCTGNSARSILAEAYLNAKGGGTFIAHSAGSHPAGAVNPFALELLRERGIPPRNPRSKSWDEFSGPEAVKFDFVFTVCDSAAAEACPMWPGNPLRAHFSVPDPAAVQGSDADKRSAFANAFAALVERIDFFMALPLERLDRQALSKILNP